MSKSDSPANIRASIALTRDSLDEATLCEKLEKRIITTAYSIYTLSSSPNILVSKRPDGTPVAQLVVIDQAGTLVLMEEAGLPPAKTGVRGHSIAMENLLTMMEAMWTSVCKTSRNTRMGGLYYVIKPMVSLNGKDISSRG